MVLRYLGGITAAHRISSSALSHPLERFVAEQSPEATPRSAPNTDTVVMLAGSRTKRTRYRERRQGDDLGRQAAARAADGLGPGPPFAPLAFWWAVTMVPSTRAYSKSGSSDRHAKTRSNTPPFTQRRKRWKTLFQLPNRSAGRARARPSHAPQHRLKEQPIVFGRRPRIGGLTGQQRRDLLPNCIAHHEPRPLKHHPNPAKAALEA